MSRIGNNTVSGNCVIVLHALHIVFFTHTAVAQPFQKKAQSHDVVLTHKIRKEKLSAYVVVEKYCRRVFVHR
jgi:hypothetical protein